MIRRGRFVEQRQRRIAVAFADFAEHLIVGAVLLDDVDHVLDGRRLSRLRIDHAVAGRLRHPVACRDTGVKLIAALVYPSSASSVKRIDHRQRAGLHGRRRIPAAVRRECREPPGPRSGLDNCQAAAVQHQHTAVGQHARRGRIPAGGNESLHAAALLRNIGDRHHVRIRARDEQPLSDPGSAPAPLGVMPAGCRGVIATFSVSSSFMMFASLTPTTKT